jgi:anti-sigma factor RsiW
VTGAPERPDCRETLEWIHAELDGDLPDARRSALLLRHLADCAACREAEARLREIHDALAALPEVPLPAAALDAVWRRAEGRRRVPWRAAAAAAVLAGVVWGLWPSGPSDAELAQAAVQVRKVFRVTSRALREAERAAFREVLAGEVSPALRSVGIQWPAERGDDGRSSEI